MANAPRPGVTRRAEETDAVKRVMRMTIRGEVHTLAIASLPIAEKMAVRQATGMPFEAFIGDTKQIGEDTIVVLWWLARRAAGERGLQWPVAAGEWPSDLAADEIEFELVDPDGTDPEA